MTVHILNQYLWPDCAPTAIYAEQLGECLQGRKLQVRVVGGSGIYRRSDEARPKPAVELLSLKTYRGKRHGMLSKIREYAAVYSAFKGYINSEIKSGDVVVATSAPPQTAHLIDDIHRKNAYGFYWLQDYYPDLLQGFVKYPEIVHRACSRYWTQKLNRWDRVIKISSNLDYLGTNAQVIRNWPTLNLGPTRPFRPLTANYFGNFGYGHCLASFLEACARLKKEGYSIQLVGDGPKVGKLPAWITVSPQPREADLRALYWQAEVHLIAASPAITGAIFPSKYWNSRQTGRRIVASGFTGPMLEELNIVSALTTLPAVSDWVPIFQ